MPKKVEDRLMNKADISYAICQEKVTRLIESGGAFRLFMLHFPGYVFIKDEKRRFLFVNKEYEDAFASKPGAMIGKSAEDFYPADEAEIIRNEDLQLLDHGRVINSVHEINLNGVSRTHLAHKFLIPFADNQRILGGFVLDITEQKLFEKKSQDYEKRYKSLFNEAMDMIHIGDENGNIIDVNPIALETLGYTREELIGKHFLELYHPDDRDAVAEDRNPLHLKNKHGNDSFPMVSKHGEKIYVETNLFVQIEDGKDIHFMAISRNITERKRMEARQKETEMQLLQNQKMEAIGTLAGGIAHDFNNILSAIFGFTELAMTGLDPAGMEYDCLQEINTAAIRARELVKQILAFSRDTKQESQPVQIKLILKEALKLIRASLPTTIEIRKDIKSDALVVADPTSINQIIMNLCANSAHAMKKEGGIFDVLMDDVTLDSGFTALYPNMVPGKYVRMIFRDTGHGMSHDMKDRIFDPFFTTKDKGEGSGMGLAVVHGMVSKLKGCIVVESEPEKGATFEIYLPAIEINEGTECMEGAFATRGSERILFVDDEPSLAKMGKRLIETLGYKVTTRTSSLEALELFREKPDVFDLIITDMTMPNMAGDELARSIMDIRPEIPVIICTGFSAGITESRVKSMGIRELVFKPIVKSDLAKTIRKVLDHD